jgi:hypothetical protein
MCRQQIRQQLLDFCQELSALLWQIGRSGALKAADIVEKR